MNEVKVSVIIPCLNEEDSIGVCINKAQQALAKESVASEIIVVDNGSTDRSPEVAKAAGARVVTQAIKGYGAAYLKGIETARGQHIVMGDGDDTYDFSQIMALLKPLDEGYDLVIGSRFKGTILKGAMSFSHRYIGNPVLTAILNTFFHSRISDAHSGFRAITRQALESLELKTLGMEFASEMIVAALRERVKIKEVPITYYPRKGTSKLNPFADAWRHLRFMFLFSPTWLFIIPGFILLSAGLLLAILTGVGKLALFGHAFDIHAMILFIFCSLLGFQIINLGIFAKTYSWLEGFVKKDAFLERFYGRLNLEKGLIISAVAFLIGFLPAAGIFIKWVRTGFGPLNEAKVGLIGLFFMAVGVQTIFSSFFLSLLGIPKRRVERRKG